MRTNKADRYWRQFIASLPPGAEQPEEYYDSFYFGVTKDDASGIADLVLQGIKTATGSLLWTYQAEGRDPPKPGDLSVVRDSSDLPVCIVETTEVRIVPYDEIDEAFAFDGGEWDRTLASWKASYWAYVVSECSRIQREPARDTPLVCERFRVIYSQPLR